MAACCGPTAPARRSRRPRATCPRHSRRVGTLARRPPTAVALPRSRRHSPPSVSPGRCFLAGLRRHWLRPRVLAKPCAAMRRWVMRFAEYLLVREVLDALKADNKNPRCAGVLSPLPDSNRGPPPYHPGTKEG